MPSAIFSPWSRTVTRSLMPMTTFMSCSMSRIVKPEVVAQLGDEGHEILRLLGVHACGRLVEQEEHRVRGECPRDLEPALVAVREVAGDLVALAVEAHQGEQLLGPPQRSLLLAPAAASS